jgi:hypothetical protein
MPTTRTAPQPQPAGTDPGDTHARAATPRPLGRPRTERPTTRRTIDPADFPGAFAYEHTDIPVGLTLTAWRHRNATPARARRVRRLLRRMRRRTAL